jgi:hypothetical protein
MNKMKKMILSMLLCLTAVCASAQLMRSEELEKYAVGKYGNKWTEAAQSLCSQLALDKNNSLTYTQVIDCPGQSKDQLYVKLNYWFVATFNDANSVIKLNDKEAGVIIANGYVSDIAAHAGGMTAYLVSIRPLIKVDIKDAKIRVTYTVQSYEVEKNIGGGILGAMCSATPNRVNETWGMETCFPFAKKDGHGAKRTSSKALIMTHAYSNVMMDKIEEAAKHGIVGNENDNW